MLDARRFSELFDALAPALILYARQWLDRSDAEDVTQEAFVRLLRQPKSPANPRAWLFTVVRHSAISQTRSASRRRRREAKELQAGDFEPSHADRLDAAAASDALKSLPAEQREVIVLRIWGQLPLREIADLVGAPTSSVFDRYQQGLQSLRQQMGVLCPTKNPSTI